MSQSFKLFRLQQIDSQLDKARNRLKEIENQLKEDKELRDARSFVTNLETRLKESSRSLTKTEQDVQDQRVKIEQTEAALYGGKIRNPKELQDLQNESAALKRYLAVLEDRQLDAMMDLEDVEAQLKTATQNHALVSARVDQKNASLMNERRILLAEVTRLEGERVAILTGIPEAENNLYEQLRQQRGGVAVARVVDSTCSACGSTLSSALLNTAQLPNQISRCTTCSRILYSG